MAGVSPFCRISALQLRPALRNGIICDALQMPHVSTATTLKNIYVREILPNLGKLFAKRYWAARIKDLGVVQFRVAMLSIRLADVNLVSSPFGFDPAMT